MHILIVEARYYQQVSEQLVAGAIAELEARGATFERIEVPGALEIPQAMNIALTYAEFDGAVALGCVIRGETSHYDIVAGESARAINDISLAREIPVGNGILTTDTREQALARARADGRNKGGAAAAACLDVAEIKRDFAARADV